MIYVKLAVSITQRWSNRKQFILKLDSLDLEAYQAKEDHMAGVMVTKPMTKFHFIIKT